MLTKEYRICMPLTVEEYRIGQLYMIARHSLEQSENGEGVETMANEPCEDEKYGKGQFTEKRIYVSSRLPYWLQSFIPKIFYVTEKAWNYYPYTITEYTCSFVPKLNVTIKTKFEDNRGETENAFDLDEEQLKDRTVEFLDIVYDEISPKHYKEEEDLRFFKSKKTDRGPLPEGWQKTVNPIMCSYKLVEASFEVWGMQTRLENFIHGSIKDILILGHRQAFAWIDEWYSMSLADVRIYECEKQRETNTKMGHLDEEQTNLAAMDKREIKSVLSPNSTRGSLDGEQMTSLVANDRRKSSSKNSSSSSKSSSPISPKSPVLEKAKSWFSWE